MGDQTDDGQVEDDLTQLVGVGGRCSYVLMAMLCLILIYPALIDSTWGRVAAACIVSSLILAVTYAIGRSRPQLIAAAALAATLLLLQRSLVRDKAAFRLHPWRGRAFIVPGIPTGLPPALPF